MVDERVQEYLKDDLLGDADTIKLKLLKRRGFLIDPNTAGKLDINNFLKNIDSDALAMYVKMNIDDAVEKMFGKDSTMGYEVCFKPKDKWSRLFASSRVYGVKVPTIQLEPFIAKLIHSLVLCGMHTYYSCDGWHAEKGKYTHRVFVGFSDRNSLIWFCILLQNDPDLKNVQTSYKAEKHFITWCYTEEERFDVYKKIDRIADILYQKRIQFRKQKMSAISELKGMQKSNLSEEDLQAMIENAYSKCGNLYMPYQTCSWEKVTEKEVHIFIEELIKSKKK